MTNETKEYSEEASTLSVDVPAFRTGWPTSFEWHGQTWLKRRDYHDNDGDLTHVEYSGYGGYTLTVFND